MRVFRPSKTTVVLGIVLLVLLSCGVLGGAAFWAGSSLDSKAKNLSTHLRDAERLGVATTLDELKVVVDDPALDARIDLEQAYNDWTSAPEDERENLSGLVRAVLSGRSEMGAEAELLKVADKFPQLAFHLDRAAIKPAFSIDEPERWYERRAEPFWQFVREGVRLMAAQAVLAGKRGDLAASEQLLAKSARIAKHLSCQGSYVPILRRLSAELELQRSLTRIAYANANKPEEMSAFIVRQQERLGPMTSAADMMRTEMPLVLADIDRRESARLRHIPLGETFNAASQSGAAEIWVRYYRKLPEDPFDQNGAERVLIAMDKEAEKTPFYGMYVNNYDRIVPLLRDVLARRRLAEMAAAYLVGEADPLIDPHTGEPLHVLEGSKDVVLYSVGQDLQDNRGTRKRSKTGALEAYDIAFRLPLPSRAKAR